MKEIPDSSRVFERECTFDPPHRPYIIGFNGPAGIGKSWTCERLAELFQNTGWRVRQCSLMTIPWEMYFAQEAHDLRLTYAQYKEFVFADGRTGRQRIIDRVEAERELNPLVWCEEFVASSLYSDYDLILLESIGFPIECDYFPRPAITRAYQHIVISPTHFSPGDQFPDDSRVLCTTPGFRRFINSTSCFNYFMGIWQDVVRANYGTEITLNEYFSHLEVGRFMDRQRDGGGVRE